MSQPEITIPAPVRNKFSTAIMIAIGAVAISIIMGLISSLNPFLVFAVVLFISFMLLFVTLKLPNFVVIFVTFIIYTNTAVVMIKFHGVTPMLGYALPLLLLFPFLWQLIAHRQGIKVNFVFVLMLVYLSIMLLGSAFSKDVNLAFPNVIAFVSEGLGLYFLLINTVRTPRTLKMVVWSILIGGAIIGGLSLYQQVTGTFNQDYWGFAQVTGTGFTATETLQGAVVQPRVSGSVGEKNRYAQIMLMVVPIGLFIAWGEKSKKLQLLAYLCTGLIFVGGSLAFSRGAQVATIILIAIMALMRYIKVQQLAILVLGIALLLAAFPQNAVRFFSLGAIFAPQEAGGLRAADGAIQGRATEMLAALLVFMDHPVIGVGPGMFNYEMAHYSKLIGLRNIINTREAHSLYPGVLAENGLLGFLTVMAIFIYALYALFQSRKYWQERGNNEMANLSTGFFLAIISYMATGLFLHFAYIRYFWMIMALAAVVSDFREPDLAEEASTAE